MQSCRGIVNGIAIVKEQLGGNELSSRIIKDRINRRRERRIENHSGKSAVRCGNFEREVGAKT